MRPRSRKKKDQIGPGELVQSANSPGPICMIFRWNAGRIVMRPYGGNGGLCVGAAITKRPPKPSPSGGRCHPACHARRMTDEGESETIAEDPLFSPSPVSCADILPRRGKNRIVRRIRGIVRIRRTVFVYSPVCRRAGTSRRPYAETSGLLVGAPYALAVGRPKPSPRTERSWKTCGRAMLVPTPAPSHRWGGTYPPATDAGAGDSPFRQRGHGVPSRRRGCRPRQPAHGEAGQRKILGDFANCRMRIRPGSF